MSDSVQPHRRQPTRLPHPWDSPGKNTGVDCHFLLQCMKVKSESEVTQSCPTLRNPMDCSPSGSSVHGTFQARVLEWGAIAFSSSPLHRPLNLSHNWQMVTEMQVWKNWMVPENPRQQEDSLGLTLLCISAGRAELHPEYRRYKGIGEVVSFSFLLASAVQDDVTEGSSMGR